MTEMLDGPELVVFVNNFPQCWFVDWRTKEISTHIGQLSFPKAGLFAASAWPDIDGNAMLRVSISPQMHFVVPRDRVAVYGPVS